MQRPLTVVASAPTRTSPCAEPLLPFSDRDLSVTTASVAYLVGVCTRNVLQVYGLEHSLTGFSLALTGPTRAIVVSYDPTYLEVFLKVKGTTKSEDKDLSALVVVFRAGACPQIVYPSRLSTLEIKFVHIYHSVEATIFIRIIDGSWSDGFRGVFSAASGSDENLQVKLLVFGDGGLPVDANGVITLSLPVVSVKLERNLKVSVMAFPINKGYAAVTSEAVLKPHRAGGSPPVCPPPPQPTVPATPAAPNFVGCAPSLVGRAPSPPPSVPCSIANCAGRAMPVCVPHREDSNGQAEVMRGHCKVELFWQTPRWRVCSEEAGRLLGQLLVMGGAVVGRAVVQAYRQAIVNAQRTGAAQEAVNGIRRASKAMTEQEARQILGISEKTSWEEIVQKYDTMFEKNAKSGSFYLQSKVHRAKECLESIHHDKPDIMN
ncbi:hypothetical protein D1007_11962 [Hordeum vulgare]|nr:hypothetical protein D1007_11962 [Hordeum vulgare]